MQAQRSRSGSRNPRPRRGNKAQKRKAARVVANLNASLPNSIRQQSQRMRNTIALPRTVTRSFQSNQLTSARNLSHRFLQMTTDPTSVMDPVVINCDAPSTVSAIAGYYDLDFTGPAAAGTNFVPRANTFIVVQRNPIWNRIIYDPNSAGAVAAYDGYFSRADAVPSQSFAMNMAAQGVLASMSAVDVPLTLAYLNSTTAYKPHGQIFWCAQHAGMSYFWIDASGGATSTVSVTVATSGLNAADWGAGEVFSVTLEVYKLTGAKEAPTLINSRTVQGAPGGELNPTAITTLVETRGYYAFKLSYVENFFLTPGTRSATITVSAFALTLGNGDQCCHLPAEGVLNNLANMSTLRTTGLSILTSNISAELYKNGDCSVTQQGSGTLWHSLITNTGDYQSKLSTSTNTSRYKFFNWEKGSYAYLKPESVDDLGSDVVKVELAANSVPSSTSFCPYTNGSYLISYVKTLNVAATPSTIARVQIGTMVQWTSANAMFQGVGAQLSPNTISELVFHLARQAQFFENPFHLMALIPIVKAVLGGIGLISGAVTGVASAVSAVKAASR